MINLRTIMGVCLFGAGFAGTFLYAQEGSLGVILENLGNVGMNAQPKISFELFEHPGAVELKRLGFALKLSHQVVQAHGPKAVSEWAMPFLRTAVYFDWQGDLIWLHPGGRTMRFRKTDSGHDNADDGSSAKVSSNGSVVEISTGRRAVWTYKGAFIESIRTDRREYFFKTNRETILEISKNGAAGRFFEIKYSEAGRLDEVVFADGRSCVFQWTPDGCLQCVNGDTGPRLDFEYDDRLIKSWRIGGGPGHELEWIPLESTRRQALGRPPVLPGGDSLYKYHWKFRGSTDILEVYRKSGAFVSRTRFSSRGIEQETPYETLTHTFRKH